MDLMEVSTNKSGLARTRLIALLVHIAIALSITACATNKQALREVREPLSEVDPPVLTVSSATTTDTPPQVETTATFQPSSTPTTTPTPVAWRTIGKGISQAYIAVPVNGSNVSTYIYTLRVDPAHINIKINYDPKQPRTIGDWQAKTGAAIVVNGGFFFGDFTPYGRIIIDGVMYGSPLDYHEDKIGIPGLFSVVDNKVEIYALGRSSYSYSPHGLRSDQAIELYPLLVLPGAQPTFPNDDRTRARRTVIGLDENGQIVILISYIAQFSLYDLSGWLSRSNLGLDIALNLDGGRSTGIDVALPEENRLIDLYVPIPTVISFYPR